MDEECLEATKELEEDVSEIQDHTEYIPNQQIN